MFSSRTKRVFDLLWVYPLPTEQKPNPVELTQDNPLDKQRPGIPGAILYPAMMTPDIVTGQQNLEILLLTKGGAAVTVEDVNQQLKVMRGLDPRKIFVTDPLFENDVARKIRITPKGVLNTNKLETDSRFFGMVDKRAVKMYKDKGFSSVVALRVHIDALLQPDSGGPTAQQSIMDNGYLAPPKIDDNQDRIIHEAVKLDELDQLWNGFKKGQYGFQSGEDVHVGVIDRSNPIQTFHPLFYLPDLQYANLGHMGDIHVSARQQILSRSQARVVEMPREGFKAVGSMINICSADTQNLFSQFGADADIDALVVGGDVVDYIKNTWLGMDPNRQLKVREIWATVDMERRRYYHDNIDFISFYSILLRFYRGGSRAKPAYALSGNHDCYYPPYGISPRAVDQSWWRKRANEGIPADHNLTMYEAILSFGRTYHEVDMAFGKIIQGQFSPFNASKFNWFYQVYTPFSDYTLKLPKQYLVALAWGEDETMISVGRPGGHGFGHLPRATHAVTNKQLNFFRSTAVNSRGDRKIILTTHFTFVSYNEALSNQMAWKTGWGNDNDEGDVYFTSTWYSTRDHSKSDMGTFQENREELYRRILGEQRAVQMILTGHSHRRGFYTLRRLDFYGNNSVKTGFHDFPRFVNGLPNLSNPQDRQEPYVILSDSGGSIPRFNWVGEFHGWGSEIPSGTKVLFDASGDVSALYVKRVPLPTAKPRIAVALDYMDIIADKKVFSKMETNEFHRDKETHDRNWSYPFNIRFRSEFYSTAYRLRDGTGVPRYGLWIESVTLYCLSSPGGRWWKVALSRAFGTDIWYVPLSEKRDFRTRFVPNRTRGIFMAIRFSSTAPHIMNRYDFSTPWTFEVKIEKHTHWYNNQIKYSLNREDPLQEIPDFDRREQYPEYR